MNTPMPVEQPPTVTPQKSSSHSILFIAGVALLVTAVSYLGYQNWQLKQQISRLDKLIQVDNTPSKLSSLPSPTPTPDPTANWKTYTNTKFGYSIQYPPALTPLETTGDIYLHQVEFKGPEETYLSGIIVEVRNFTNLEEEVSYRKWQVVGHITDKLDSEIPISISGLSGKRLNYFSGQKQFSTIIVPYQKLVYTVEAESNLLDQILSTFKFFDKGSSIPVSITNLKKLTYYLPTGWRTVQDKTGSFEIGYDPSISKVSEPIEENTVSIYRTDRILGSFITARLLPYSGESRHQFLYAQIGEKPVNEDLLPTYHESEYSYNGKSCLFLVGIAISQYPTTWGMCDAGNKKAFLVTSYDDNVYEKFVQTIRLMK